MVNAAAYLRARLGREFLGYFTASLVALGIDMALLLMLVRVMHPLAAATIAFLCGLLVCYALVVRFVFSERRYGTRRTREAAIFFLVGLVGLGVNDAVIYLGHVLLMLPLALSKLGAAALSFLFNFIIRKFLLFRRRDV